MGCSRVVAGAALALGLLLGACDLPDHPPKPGLSTAAFPAQVAPGGVTVVAVEVQRDGLDWTLCLALPGEGEDALSPASGGPSARQWKYVASGSGTVSVLYVAEEAPGDRVVAVGLHHAADADCSLEADELATLRISVGDQAPEPAKDQGEGGDAPPEKTPGGEEEGSNGGSNGAPADGQAAEETGGSEDAKD